MFGCKFDAIDMHKNKSGKIIFGRSVIAVRDFNGGFTKLIPATEGCYIHIIGFANATVGGNIKGSTGVQIFNDHLLSEHGKGLMYKFS